MPRRQELEFRDFKGGGTLTDVENTEGQPSRSKGTAETKQSYPPEEINPLTRTTNHPKSCYHFPNMLALNKNFLDVPEDNTCQVIED